jgi:hypothetical protein
MKLKNEGWNYQNKNQLRRELKIKEVAITRMRIKLKKEEEIIIKKIKDEIKK